MHIRGGTPKAIAAALVVLATVAGPAGGRAPGYPDDPMLADQWGLEKIHAVEAWAESNATGRGIKIAFVDGGIDARHEDFACPGKLEILPGSNLGSKSRPDNPQETIGFHGTFVAGIAGACTDNGTGIAGVAPGATLIPIRIIARARTASIDVTMAEGIRFATAAGAHVINLALGDIPPWSHADGSAYPETEAALREARQAGIVIPAAAGNYAQPLCEYPARSKNVICVVATDSDDMHAAYSDLAVNVDRYADPPGIEPAVAAPGGQGTTCAENILSTVPADGFSSCSEDGYEAAFGTSAATPYVSGVAALLYEQLGPRRSTAKANLIVQTILATADDLYTPGWDPLVGHGRLNALEAVRAIEASAQN